MPSTPTSTDSPAIEARGRAITTLLAACLILTLVPTCAAATVGCGSWQQDYIALHQSILAGKAPQRYAMATVHKGLADAQVGAVAVFYYALLTRRAFIWSYDNLEDVYEAPNVNWTVPWGSESLVQNGTYWMALMNNRDGKTMDRMWRTTDLTALAQNHSHVIIKANRGMTFELFQNPHHAAHLRAMGLTPESAFGCAINFLIRLRPDVEAEFASIRQKMRSARTLKIGVQVRTGDKTMANQQSINFTQVHAFFACAEEVERTRGKQYPGGVLWYLISDSISVRAQAAAMYGDKVVQATGTLSLGHVTSWRHRPKNVSSKAAIRLAAAEQWFLGMADVHIITRASSFGRAACFRSLQQESLYTIHRGDQPRHCGAQDFDKLDVAGRYWARVM